MAEATLLADPYGSIGTGSRPFAHKRSRPIFKNIPGSDGRPPGGGP